MPHHLAALHGSLSILQWLILERGVPVKARQTRRLQWNALHLACKAGHLDTVMWLVEAGGANASEKDKDGNFPHDNAMSYRHLIVGEYLRLTICNSEVSWLLTHGFLFGIITFTSYLL